MRKKIISQLTKKNKSAFTLVEMLVVLFILSILILIMVPNLMKHKEFAEEKADRAIVKVVESQAAIYEVSHAGEKATLANMKASKYLTKEQVEKYKGIKNEDKNVPEE